MSHIDERDADLALNALELELHDVAQLEVQRTERLVEQQGAGVVDQRPGQRNALLLTTRELGGLALGEVGEPDHLEQLVDALADGGLVLLLAARSVGDVVPDGHVGEQRVVLEDGVDVAFVRRHPRNVDALEPNGALGGALEARDHPQGGGLPAAGRSEHREELAGTDREVGVGDRDVIVEAFGDMVDLNDRRAGGALGSGLAGGLLGGGGAGLGQGPSPLSRGPTTSATGRPRP